MYESRARETGAPDAKMLCSTFGGWQAACVHFGLDYSRQRSWSREDVAVAEVAAAVAEDRAMRIEMQERGLDVCGARPLSDGRMAYMLR